MKRTLFLVEGQTEQIFLANFAQQLCAIGKYVIFFEKYHAGQIIKIATRGVPEEDATHCIQIMNMQGDDSVNTYIRDNLPAIKAKGVDFVFGLRDRYTGTKQKGKINPRRIDEWTDQLSREQGLTVEITIAIEEIEAWFLSVPGFFLKYHEKLDLGTIENIVGFKLEQCDVEKIDHPASLIDLVLKSVELSYRKRAADSHRIAAGLDYASLYLEKAENIAPLGRLVRQLSQSLPETAG